MALLESELYRLKAELGFNVLQTGAEPYVGVHPFFDVVLRPYLQSGALTSSATPVGASTSPALVTLTLASATGFAPMARVVVDVDSAQEIAMVEAVNGSTISLRLQKAHAGTYPVTVEGGESLIREHLAEITRIKGEMRGQSGTGALKRVDDVEFHAVGGGGRTQFDALTDQLEHWRRELAQLIGLPYGRSHGGGCGCAAVY